MTPKLRLSLLGLTALFSVPALSYSAPPETPLYLATVHCDMGYEQQRKRYSEYPLPQLKGDHFLFPLWKFENGGWKSNLLVASEDEWLGARMKVEPDLREIPTKWKVAWQIGRPAWNVTGKTSAWLLNPGFELLATTTSLILPSATSHGHMSFFEASGIATTQELPIHTFHKIGIGSSDREDLIAFVLEQMDIFIRSMPKEIQEIYSDNKLEFERGGVFEVFLDETRGSLFWFDGRFQHVDVRSRGDWDPHWDVKATIVLSPDGSLALRGGTVRAVIDFDKSITAFQPQGLLELSDHYVVPGHLGRLEDDQFYLALFDKTTLHPILSKGRNPTENQEPWKENELILVDTWFLKKLIERQSQPPSPLNR